MAIPQDKLSSEFVDAVYIAPEGRDRLTLLQDFEGGPKALIDTSEGLNYQDWRLEYIDPVFTLYPETFGAPVTALSAAGAEQASFCFDQNGRPSLVYIKDSSAFLYWYSTVDSDYVTTEFPGVVSAMLSLDDKRDMEIEASDIIFWYTKAISPTSHSLYQRKQRDRFLTEYEMTSNCFPYLYKTGMHKGLRGKIVLRAGPYWS